MNKEDLGFNFQITKQDDVLISHFGRTVTTLRGKFANRAIVKLNTVEFSQQQQLMARLTGHYKHGNERQEKLA